MRRTSLGDYLESPPGKWVSGERWLHFCATKPWLSGVLIWGHVDETTIDVVLRCATAVHAAIPEPHPALIDGARATSYDLGIFTMGHAYLSQHGKDLGRVSQLAGVRPFGPVGALMEGFFRVVPEPYPVRVFGEREEALGWLGREQHAALIAEAEHLAGAVTATSRILGDLHRAIETRLADSDLARTAKELGLSVRSLQRHLSAEGTSFQRELSMVRVRVAQRLMLDGSTSLAEVAEKAGFSSPAKFSVAFRKVTGTTPSEWRDARRSPPNASGDDA